MTDVFSISGKNIHKVARASVISALSEVAEMKNVPLDRALREYLAGSVLNAMDFPSLHRLSSHEEDGLVAMVKEINAHLDATAMVRLRHLISVVERKDSPDDPVVEAAMQAIVAKFTAALPEQGCPRWPELAELVSDYYATVPRGPIVETRDDGVAYTTYWLGRDLHRDPKDGPALHGVKDEKQGWEYRVRGQLHRDPSAGPAWWHFHDARTDRIAARPFTELRYCVRGQLHRDEKDGPAWIERDNETGVLVTEQYWRDGVPHRVGGPAIIERSPDGAVTYETFYVAGEHRPGCPGPIEEGAHG